MIVRMFQQQFAALVESGAKCQTVRHRDCVHVRTQLHLVESGAKCQTVRHLPKRLPQPGERISLRAWTGKPYRSKQRVLREATITRVDGFSIDTFPTMRINDIGLKYRSACDDFARADGFTDYPALLEWFRATHGLPFEGIVIYWSPI